jgi:hypothetical protein
MLNIMGMISLYKIADITAQESYTIMKGYQLKGQKPRPCRPSGSILMVCIGTIGKCQVINEHVHLTSK